MSFSKRQLLSTAMCRTGLLWAMEHAFSRRGLLIWNYH